MVGGSSGNDGGGGEKEDVRVTLRCPHCDHVIARVEPGHVFREAYLVCPGCTAEVEVPDGPVEPDT